MQEQRKQRERAAEEKFAIVIEGLREKKSMADSNGVEDYIALCREIKEME